MSNDKDKALRRLADWADLEDEAHEQRVAWTVASRRLGATIYEIAAAAKKSPQGIGKAIKKMGITIDNHVRGE